MGVIWESALARGHNVTLFNRGKTNPGLFPQVETILGDREHDIEKLAVARGMRLLTLQGIYPRIVRLSATSLERAAGRYVFISSISVYADTSKIGINNPIPLGKSKMKLLKRSPASRMVR